MICRAQLARGEADRSYLLGQLVAVKKDNAVLGAEAGALEQEIGRLEQRKRDDPMAGLKAGGALHERPLSPGMPKSPGAAGERAAAVRPPSEGEANAAYEAARAKGLSEIKRVKALLAEQQARLRAARSALARELSGRTDLQRFLKRCLLDVRHQVAVLENPAYALGKAVQVAGAKELIASGIMVGATGGGGGGGAARPTSAARSAELLKSKDRVVSLLYHKAFPMDGVAGTAPASPPGAGGSPPVSPSDGGAPASPSAGGFPGASPTGSGSSSAAGARSVSKVVSKALPNPLPPSLVDSVVVSAEEAAELGLEAPDDGVSLPSINGVTPRSP